MYGRRDLIARGPDAVAQERGHLEPQDERPWGEWTDFGWEREASPRHVWSSRARAFLGLRVVHTADRVIDLEAWAPPGKELPAEVRLNEVALGTVTLTDRPERHSVEAPEQTWIVGKNVLEIEVPETTELDGRPVGFALSSVTFGAPLLIEEAERTTSLVLVPETSTRYDLELLGPTRLHLAGRARGTGHLSVRMEAMDPSTGDELAPPLFEISIDLADTTFERALALPDPRSDVLVLRLTWYGERRSEVELTKLELAELEPVDRFPILFVSVDTLAASHLPMYGYSRPTTPNLERLAQDAVLFEHGVSNAPWTLPSYLSQMTGLYALSHQIGAEGRSRSWEKWSLAPNRWTLAEFLRAAGYRAGGFVDNLWITPRFGLAQGFDVLDSTAAKSGGAAKDGTRTTTSRALAWLDDLPRDAPWFLFLHTNDVHGPYWPDDRYRGRFRGDDLYRPRTAPAGGPLQSFDIIHRYIARSLVPEGPVPPRLSVADLEAAYDEGILAMDDDLGVLLDAMEQRGVYDRALILVSADHGETMDGSRLLFGHGVLDEAVLHVPLLVKLPGNRHAGTRIAESVQLVDLFPTIMELLGRPPHDCFHGRSLVDLIEGASTGGRPILSEGGLMRQASVVADGWKLVEQWPDLDVEPQTLISFTDLSRDHVREVALAVAQDGGDRAPWRWLEDEALVDDVFGRLPRSGLTQELFDDMRTRPEYDGFLQTLSVLIPGPCYSLYDLSVDPRCENDLSDAEPGRLEALRAVLRTEQARREEARERGRPTNIPVTLAADDLDELRKLGYVED